jgi:hypothetical protein
MLGTAKKPALKAWIGPMSDVVLKLLLVAVAAVVLLELASVASTGHLLDRPHPIWDDLVVRQ